MNGRARGIVNLFFKKKRASRLTAPPLACAGSAAAGMECTSDSGMMDLSVPGAELRVGESECRAWRMRETKETIVALLYLNRINTEST